VAYKNKTVPTKVSPAKFLGSVENERRRKDGQEILKLMRSVTGEKPVMWGPSIIGFGRQAYRTEGGHEGEIMIVGFSPRKANLVLYIGSALNDAKLMNKLGKHRRGKGCLYINKLDDIDRDVLRQLVEKSASATSKRDNST
jgi:hypothetical protein